MNATVGTFAFLAPWNDFMMPSLVTADPAWPTLPVIQNIFQLKFCTNHNVAFASYLMAMAHPRSSPTFSPNAG
jgi:raffinose/stachyose/melibiose transport system permease protein